MKAIVYWKAVNIFDSCDTIRKHTKFEVDEAVMAYRPESTSKRDWFEAPIRVAAEYDDVLSLIVACHSEDGLFERETTAVLSKLKHRIRAHHSGNSDN